MKRFKAFIYAMFGSSLLSFIYFASLSTESSFYSAISMIFSGEAPGIPILLVLTGLGAALGYGIVSKESELMDYVALVFSVSLGAVNTFSLFASYEVSRIREIPFQKALSMFFDDYFELAADFNDCFSFEIFLASILAIVIYRHIIKPKKSGYESLLDGNKDTF